MVDNLPKEYSEQSILNAVFDPDTKTLKTFGQSAQRTDVIYENGVALPIKRAIANVAQSQTDSSIVSLVAGKRIKVLQVLALAGATATNLTFNSKPSGGAGVAISPLLANGANGGEVLPYSPIGWFETLPGEALTVTTGAGATTGILIKYVESSLA